MQEPYGAFTWYPVNDQPADKAFYDVRVDVPGRWVGVSNGRLCRRTSTGRTRTAWRLTHPAASYLVTVAIGPYRRYDDTGPHGLPITYWVRPADQRLLPVVRRAPDSIRWLEDRLGRLPSDRMGFVIVPEASGMETQDMITLGRDHPRGRRPGRHARARAPVVRRRGHPVGLARRLDERGHGDVPPGRVDGDPRAATWDGWESQFRTADDVLRKRYGPPGAFKRDQFAQANVYYCAALMWRVLHDELGDSDVRPAAPRLGPGPPVQNADRDQLRPGGARSPART